MALDKIIDSTKLDAALTATADAIRAKTGLSDPVPFDETTGFKSTIESMEVGSGSSEWETVMPETAITFDDGGEYVSFETVYPLTTGKRYKVKWGDTEYESTAVDTVFDGMPCVAIGNVGALAGNPDETPFIVGYIPSANGFGIMRVDGADGVQNVAIYKSNIPLPVIQPLEITENGTFSAPEGVDGYSPITVNVASSGGGSIEGAHTITFMSEDGSAVLGTKPVMNGDTCGDPVALGLFATPTKESTAQYDYSFYGWATVPNGAADGNALANITEDRTVYANFASAVRYYTVNYYDGDTLLKTEQLAYGTTPSYEPEKAGVTFSNWEPALAVVTGDINYQAVWREKEWTLIFADTKKFEYNNVWGCCRESSYKGNSGVTFVEQAVAGDTYKVVYDGTPYVLTARDDVITYKGYQAATSTFPLVAALGNVGIPTKGGGVNYPAYENPNASDEPFLISNYSDAGYHMWLPESAAGTHTFEVYK